MRVKCVFRLTKVGEIQAGYFDTETLTVVGYEHLIKVPKNKHVGWFDGNYKDKSDASIFTSTLVNLMCLWEDALIVIEYNHIGFIAFSERRYRIYLNKDPIGTYTTWEVCDDCRVFNVSDVRIVGVQKTVLLTREYVQPQAYLLAIKEADGEYLYCSKGRYKLPEGLRYGWLDEKKYSLECTSPECIGAGYINGECIVLKIINNEIIVERR